MIRINNDWKYIFNWSDELLNGNVVNATDVRLPHNVGQLPLHYAVPEAYQTVCGYYREFSLDEIADKKIFLQFDGAAHIAEVFVNGQPVCKHYGGYTAFRADVTETVQKGTNQLAVKLDCTENPELPPFGHVMDYLGYGGLYRDVWLDIRPETYIEHIFVRTIDTESIRVDVSCSGSADRILAEIIDQDRHSVNATFSFRETPSDDKPEKLFGNDEESGHSYYYAVISVPEARLWSVEDPFLYQCEITVKKDEAWDRQKTTFGMRTAQFHKDGFYLNGKKLFLRGLNRHQSYPYIGYAATESLQKEDARILKQELACNAVRTSHYPQSQYFIDACDQLGLCVFTELPGWQHIGDETWKQHALSALKEMILQYRNHPSVILWGVRINESVDDDAFYTKTNALAHALDPSRSTSGVRYLQKSSFLEDVYAFNDFSYDGKSAGCLKKSEVSGDPEKPYLISECNGHMYPVKPFDDWTQRQEQALRHATVLNAAMSEDGIAGCFAWCMFDYATHKDFGAGDRICYHGVLDSFRNMKPAAWLYSSQNDEIPVLKIGSSFDIGDYPGGGKGLIYAFTNADEVRLYKNDAYVSTFYPKEFPALPHSPILIDDTIGELINQEPGYTPKQAELVRKLLLSAEKHGFSHLPNEDKLRLAHAHFRYKLSFEDGYALYGKYFNNWGDKSVKWKFEGWKDGKLVKTVYCAPGTLLHLEAITSDVLLQEGDVYDMALVRIRLADENGNSAPYAQLSLSLKAEGAITIVGPSMITAEGGMCGVLVKTNGKNGSGTLTISTDPYYGTIRPIKVNFEVNDDRTIQANQQKNPNKSIIDRFQIKVNKQK